MKKLLVGIFIGFALGAASFALASPHRQARPYCTGTRSLDIYTACVVVRNWCPYVTQFAKPVSQPDDPQVVRLLELLRDSCPRAWRR